jgi:hypothetical protein
MRRRAFLASGATAVASVSALASCAHTSPPTSPPSDQPLPPEDLDGAVAKVRAQYVAQFDADYVDNVVLPSFLNSVFDGERPVLPMIDVALTKENALPYDMWGLLSMSWKPAPDDGVTVFLQGLDKRGPDNRRKRIYMSAVTPDLYQGMYQTKIVGFFDQLFSDQNASKPLMRIYLDTFWDLYWDLHLGVKGQDIPQQVRQIGENFNTVLAYRDPTQKIVYDNYMAVRKNLDFLKAWIDPKGCEGAASVRQGRRSQPREGAARPRHPGGNGADRSHHRHQRRHRIHPPLLEHRLDSPSTGAGREAEARSQRRRHHPSQWHHAATSVVIEQATASVVAQRESATQHGSTRSVLPGGHGTTKPEWRL